MADPVPTRTEQVTTNLPDWAKPFAMQLFGATFGDPNQPGGGLLGRGYETYQGPVVSGYSPMQEQAFRNLAGMQVSPEIGQATGMAGLAGLAAQRAGAYDAYSPGQFYTSPQYSQEAISSQDVAAPSAGSAYQMAAPSRVASQGYGPLTMQGPGSISAERLGAEQMGPAERVGVERVGMEQMGPAERVGAERFGLGAMQEYMSPYMQGVVERQKQGAVQDYLKQLPGMGAAAARAGARGGTRASLLQAEAQRGLADRLGDIEAQGLQAAYGQASQQFGQDRAAAMQAAMANQQAGLTTGQQNLAARLQAAGMNQQAAQQAALANQQAGLTTGQQNLAARMQAGQLNQATGLQAALANQQMGFNVGQQNLGAEQARQQFMGQQGLQAQLANQQAEITAGQQNLQALINQGQFGAAQQLQARLANQQAQLQAQQQRLGQSQALNQFNQQNAAMGAQYGLAGQQLGEQSRQFGANLGLQGIQQQLASAGMLGNLGGQRYQQAAGINQAQLGAGQYQQQQAQRQLDQEYQNFINKQQYPYKQLEFASGILRGFQPTGQTSTLYQQPGSSLGATAATGLGLGSLFGSLGGG